jgi:methyl-accepting chemotaxis protein
MGRTSGVEGTARQPGPGRLSQGFRSRMPLGIQALAGVGGLLCLVVTSIVIAGLFIMSVRGDEERLNDHAVPFATAVASASLNAKGVANDQRGFLLTGNRTFLVELEGRVSAARASFDDAAAAASGAAEEQAVARARVGFDRWRHSVRAEFSIFRSGHRELAVADAMGHNRDVRKAYEGWLDRAATLSDHAIESDTQTVEQASTRSVAILLGVLLVALVGGCSIAFWLVRSIVKPMYALLAILSRGATA